MLIICLAKLKSLLGCRFRCLDSSGSIDEQDSRHAPDASKTEVSKRTVT
jgi:hypothetical protein